MKRTTRQEQLRQYGFPPEDVTFAIQLWLRYHTQVEYKIVIEVVGTGESLKLLRKGEPLFECSGSNGIDSQLEKLLLYLIVSGRYESTEDGFTRWKPQLKHI